MKSFLHRATAETVRFSHEWDVIADPGAGRFVECDEGGVPLDDRRYHELRADEARGDLVYLGIRRHEPGDQPRSLGLGNERDTDDEGRSYRTDVIEGSKVSGESLAGDMGLYRE